MYQGYHRSSLNGYFGVYPTPSELRERHKGLVRWSWFVWSSGRCSVLRPSRSAFYTFERDRAARREAVCKSRGALPRRDPAQDSGASFCAAEMKGSRRKRWAYRWGRSGASASRFGRVRRPVRASRGQAGPDPAGHASPIHRLCGNCQTSHLGWKHRPTALRRRSSAIRFCVLLPWLRNRERIPLTRERFNPAERYSNETFWGV